MGNDLNQFFVTFKIYKDGVLVKEIESPRSMIQRMFMTWVFPGSSYTVHVVDHTGNFRISSDIFNG